MLVKRMILVISIILITVAGYIFMNRNYDPLSRYPYDITESERSAIIEYMDEREIKYIIDYSIAPEEFMPYIESSKFKAYDCALYKRASMYFYYLNNNQIVEVVEKIIDKDLDIETSFNEFMYLNYEEITQRLNR